MRAVSERHRYCVATDDAAFSAKHSPVKKKKILCTSNIYLNSHLLFNFAVLVAIFNWNFITFKLRSDL